MTHSFSLNLGKVIFLGAAPTIVFDKSRLAELLSSTAEAGKQDPTGGMIL